MRTSLNGEMLAARQRRMASSPLKNCLPTAKVRPLRRVWNVRQKARSCRRPNGDIYS
jgi:hypothetical protein